MFGAGLAQINCSIIITDNYGGGSGNHHYEAGNKDPDTGPQMGTLF